MDGDARVTEFVSSQAELAKDGTVAIALFDGEAAEIELLRCSATAALNLIGEIAVCLRSAIGPNGNDRA